MVLLVRESKFIRRAQGYQEIVAGQVLSKIRLSIHLKLVMIIMVMVNRELYVIIVMNLLKEYILLLLSPHFKSALELT